MDLALDYEVLKRKGSWIAYKGETLGLGKEAAAKLLMENLELRQEITEETLRKSQEELVFVPSQRDEDTEEPAISSMDVEDEVLELETE